MLRKAALFTASLITGLLILAGLGALVDDGTEQPNDALGLRMAVNCARKPDHPRCRATPTEGPTWTPTASPAPTLTPTVIAFTPTASAIPVPTVAAPALPATQAATSTAFATVAATPTPSVPPTATTVVAAPVSPCLGVPAYPEQRPANTTANQTRGHRLTGVAWPEAWQPAYLGRVDGDCVGTTEQILEWTQRKWFPEFSADIFKAQAVAESFWHQSAQGDWNGSAYESFGILQVRCKYWAALGDACAQVKASTAYAADTAAAVMRAHYDGVLYTGQWWPDQPYLIGPSVPNPDRFRRAINAWYAGDGATHDPSSWAVTGDGQYSEYVSLIHGGTVRNPGYVRDGQTLSGYIESQPWKAGF